MKFLEMSFINEKGEWQPERPDDYAEACDRGARYADEMLTAMRDGQNPTIVGAVLRAITAGAVFDSVEIGFCQRLGIQLMV